MTRRRLQTRSLVPTLLVLLAVGGVGAHGRPSQATRSVHAAIVDVRGTPLPGLTAADFSVRVNDRDVNVLSAIPATDPLAIVIVTDGLDLRITPQVREAMRAVVTAAREQAPSSRVGFIGAPSGAVPKLHGVVEGQAQLERTIATFIGSEETWPLLASVLAATETLARERFARRVIIAIGRRHDQPAELIVADREADALRRTGTTLWALDMGWSDVLANVAPRSGGHHAITRPEELAATARKLMHMIRSQYLVTYAPPPDDPAGSLRVGVRRDPAIVLAPVWTPRER